MLGVASGSDSATTAYSGTATLLQMTVPEGCEAGTRPKKTATLAVDPATLTSIRWSCPQESPGGAAENRTSRCEWSAASVVSDAVGLASGTSAAQGCANNRCATSAGAAVGAIGGA